MHARGTVAIGLIAFVFLGPSCSHAPPWQAPHSGWQAVTSEHFVLYTEAWSPVYRYVVNRLEDSHAGLSRTFFGDLELPTIEVLLLSEGDYEALRGTADDGVYAPDAAPGGLLAIKQRRHRELIDEIVAHELVHRFIARKYPSMPLWLNEGIASYLSTIRVLSDEVEVGRLSGTTEQLGKSTLLSLRQLAEADVQVLHGPQMREGYHAATELVRFLLHPQEDGVESTRWHRLVGSYGPGAPVKETPDGIMTRVYPELDWADLQRQVQSHIDTIEGSRKYPIWTFPFQPPARGSLRAKPADPDHVKRLCLALRAR